MKVYCGRLSCINCITIAHIVGASIALLMYLLAFFYHMDKGDDTEETAGWAVMSVAGLIDLSLAWGTFGSVNGLRYMRLKCIMITTAVLWILSVISGVVSSHKNSDSNVWVFLGFAAIETILIILWIWYLA